MSRWSSMSPLWNQLQASPMWSQLQQLQREMNRLVDRWADGGPGVAAVPFPAVNIWEDGESLYLEAELPGVAQSDLEILVSAGDQLTIKGERKDLKPESGVWHRQERAVGSFARTLTLPFDVDQGKVDARLENGILRLQLPKHESTKARKIKVKGE